MCALNFVVDPLSLGGPDRNLSLLTRPFSTSQHPLNHVSTQGWILYTSPFDGDRTAGSRRFNVRRRWRKTWYHRGSGAHV